MLNFFKRPLPRVIAVIIALAFAFWARAFIIGVNGNLEFTSFKMPLFALLVNLIGGNHILSMSISFVFLLGTALYLIQVNTKHIIVKTRTYLPSFFYITFCSSFLPLQQLNPAIFSAFFVVLALDFVFSISTGGTILDNLFKAGFLSAIAALFYLPSAAVFLIVLLAIIFFNLNGFRPWLSTLAGFIAPWFLTGFYFYFFRNEIQAIPNILEASIQPTGVPKFFTGIFHIILYSFSAILLLISSFFLLGSLSLQKIVIRKFNSLLLWLMVFIGIIALATPFCGAESIYILSVPLTFVFTNFFTSARSRFWTEFFFVGILLIALMAHILPLIRM